MFGVWGSGVPISSVSTFWLASAPSMTALAPRRVSCLTFGAGPALHEHAKACRRLRTTQLDNLKASKRGQDKRGRRRSAAIPPNELSQEKVGKMWQHIATYGNKCANVCARKTNYCKMHSLRQRGAQQFSRADPDGLQRHADLVLEHFGAERLCLGSFASRDIYISPRNYCGSFVESCGDLRRLPVYPSHPSNSIAEICGDDESAQKPANIQVRELP